MIRFFLTIQPNSYNFLKFSFVVVVVNVKVSIYTQKHKLDLHVDIHIFFYSELWSAGWGSWKVVFLYSPHVFAQMYFNEVEN